MRIYGSSPLYNYVELIFRCKRMFILAIILGTLITSLMVYSRPATYQANMVIQLTGDPETNVVMNDLNRRDRRAEAVAVRRKYARLSFWVKNDRNFIPTVLRDINLDRKYGPEKLDEITAQLQKKLEKPKLLNGQYMNVSIVWGNPTEAEQILNALYARFASRTVATETAAVTNRRIALETQFKQAEAEANRAAQRRVEYLTDHWWQNTQRLPVEMGKYDSLEQQLSTVRFDMAEARMRLDGVLRELRATDKMIVQSKSTLRIVEDPAMRVAQELDELKKQLAQLRTRYQDVHPAVRDVLKRIEDKEREKAEAVKRGPQEKQQEIKEDKQLNPKWVKLDDMRTQLEATVRQLGFRQSGLEKRLARTQANIERMPPEEIRYSKIDREYKLANNFRNQLQALLKAARYDEERDKLLQSQSLDLFIKPKAEKQETAGKAALLYALGPILGVIIAFCFSLVAEALDHTLRTPVEVERYLGKPVLAVIPKIHAPREGRKRLAGGSRTGISS